MLIDTNVWGELARPRPNSRVLAFLEEHDDRLHLSTIVLSEIEYGIANASDPVRAERLLNLRNAIVLRVEDRILQPDFLTATIWGKLKAELVSQGQPITDFDLIIGAQAIAAGMPVVSRNVAHLARTGAFVINPWDS